MTRPPRISIITPTLNSAGTLARCLDSVKVQTFPDWEHWIIDGQSTDATLEQVRQRDYLRWISKPDGGVFEAMNRGLGLATGEWVYFLGADDYLFNDRVLEHVARHLDESVDVVYGDVNSSRFGGRYDGEFDIDKIQRQNICHQAIFLRKSLFAATGPFKTQYRGQADWDHNLAWFLNPALRHKWIDVVIAEYADQGVSSVNGDAKFQDEKPYRTIVYGRKALPPDQLFLLSRRQVKVNFKQGRLIRSLRAGWIALGALGRKSTQAAKAS